MHRTLFNGCEDADTSDIVNAKIIDRGDMSDQIDDLYAMRHSLAHIMATAIMKLWPEAKLGIGPVVENGFYYDVDIEGVKISEEDFKKIEKEMRAVIEENQEFVRSDKQIDEAIEWAETSRQPYKVELLNDLKRAGTTVAKDLNAQELGTIAGDDSKADSASFYTNGEFTDLCRGPHVSGTGKVGAFKLLRVAGAYWRGKEDNPQMQRVYGVAFESEQELTDYLEMLEEAKKRDHRKLGRELDIYTSSELVGSGLPLFTPRGTILRELLGSYSQSLREKRGFERVWTPHITKTDLYKKSGHWEKFGDELFLVKSQETSDELVMKPMNCPHHTQIYSSQPRSYKDLPIRFMENTTDYRDEKSGELHGLSRVRSLTQDDSHVFCSEDQIGTEVSELVHAAQEMYEEFDMKLKFRLSFKDDGDGYLGEEKLWNQAQDELEKLAKENELDYYIETGEAAFYGPKIDFLAVDAIDREWQVATIQLDFVQPSRFELEYTDSDGLRKTPVMIHCALLGTIERFLSVYIEHTAGLFPFWLAPEQVRILQINDKVGDYVSRITEVLNDTVLMRPLKYNELRYKIDDRNESLGKKIREAQVAKIPILFIVGPKDQEAETISVRTREGESKIKLSELGGWLENQNS